MQRPENCSKEVCESGNTNLNKGGRKCGDLCKAQLWGDPLICEKSDTEAFGVFTNMDIIILRITGALRTE